MSRDGLAHCKTWHNHEFIDHKLPKQELSHKYARYLIHPTDDSGTTCQCSIYVNAKNMRCAPKCEPCHYLDTKDSTRVLR